MISGNSLGRRLAALATVLVMLVAAPALAADGWGLERLMAVLAEVKSSEARFIQRDTVSLLTEPVETSGTLSYTRPDMVEKRTLQPREESLRVDGDRLTLTQADGVTRSVGLSAMPEIEAYVESIRATLRGDLSTLKRFYNVALEGEAAGWRLQLAPLGQSVREMVRLIVISGRDGAIGEVDIYQTDGDQSSMTILPGPA
ncbi:LolA family protein [Skermanella stibiiresistens]|uniref:LolA family protein n=1 Tax=Skermanella stibiiresistens TaxID=913326 RepID=UPI0004AFE443|nr:LolA-related protein [Skermanella stibiiresistens]